MDVQDCIGQGAENASMTPQNVNQNPRDMIADREAVQEVEVIPHLTSAIDRVNDVKLLKALLTFNQFKFHRK